jgi:hypothetical protein
LHCDVQRSGSRPSETPAAKGDEAATRKTNKTPKTKKIKGKEARAVKTNAEEFSEERIWP